MKKGGSMTGVKKVGAMRRKLTWRVIAVFGDGSSPGNCGHHHATQSKAEACPWTPTPWPEQCDLLVREIRDRRGEP